MSDIYISYGSENARVARLLSSQLAQRGYRVHTRADVPAGTPVAEGIAYQIKSSHAFVILISDQSPDEGVMSQELGLALQYNKQVLPVTVGQVALPETMEYALARIQPVIIDAYARGGVDRLMAALPQPVYKPVRPPRGKSRLPLALGIGAVALVCLLGTAILALAMASPDPTPVIPTRANAGSAPALPTPTPVAQATLAPVDLGLVDRLHPSGLMSVAVPADWSDVDQSDANASNWYLSGTTGHELAMNLTFGSLTASVRDDYLAVWEAAFLDQGCANEGSASVQEPGVTGSYFVYSCLDGSYEVWVFMEQAGDLLLGMVFAAPESAGSEANAALFDRIWASHHVYN